MSLTDAAPMLSHTAQEPPYAATDSADSVDCLTGNDTSETQTQHRHWLVGCVAQSANAGLWLANLPCPALGLQPTGDHYVGKPSATGQPTRPTQPFVPPGSINE